MCFTFTLKKRDHYLRQHGAKNLGTKIPAVNPRLIYRLQPQSIHFQAMSTTLVTSEDLQFYADKLRPYVNELSPLVDSITTGITKTFVETGEVVRSVVFPENREPVADATIEVHYDGTWNRIVAAHPSGEREGVEEGMVVETVIKVSQPKPAPKIVPMSKKKSSKLFGSLRKSKSVAAC
jgi:hypothetical protein